MNKKINIAVLGATGAVGEVLLHILAERAFPAHKVYALGSARSAGEQVLMGRKMLTVELAETFDFSQVDLAFFTAGKAASMQYMSAATAAGCVVIDNTSAYRYDEDVPLVIPEINPEDIAQVSTRGIIANPNCATIQMLMAVHAIHQLSPIKRVRVSTYQSVSGAGKAGIRALASETAALLNGTDAPQVHFPESIAFNLIPCIDEMQDNGFTREEMKMVWETQKILHDPSIDVEATCVRVPVFYGHGEAIYVESSDPVSLTDIQQALKQAPGVKLFEAGTYPTPKQHLDNENAVLIGRVRKGLSCPNAVSLWTVSDNIRKGAALNSVQIAESWLKMR